MARVYRQSGVPADKVHVIPWGIDPAVFHPAVPPLHLPPDCEFAFLFVGGTLHRKGFDLLLAAFLAEFSPQEPVWLIVKDVGTQSFYRHGHQREQVLAARDAGARLIYLEEDLTPGQLASLYAAADCLAAPFRGEGFGLPILEAMACGTPVIVPQGGAADDFVDAACGYLLPAREVETEHPWRLCGPATELAIDPAAQRLAGHLRTEVVRTRQARQAGAQHPPGTGVRRRRRELRGRGGVRGNP